VTKSDFEVLTNDMEVEAGFVSLRQMLEYTTLSVVVHARSGHEEWRQSSSFLACPPEVRDRVTRIQHRMELRKLEAARSYRLKTYGCDPGQIAYAT